MSETIAKLVDMLFDNGRGIDFAVGKVAILVNNLGALSVLEIQVLADEAIGQVRKRNSNVVRVFVGTFVTSLDGPGFSITLLKLDDELLPLLDAPTAVSNWPRSAALDADVGLEHRLVMPQLNCEAKELGACSLPRMRSFPSKAFPSNQCSDRLSSVSRRVLSKVIESMAESVGQEEPQITKYDTIAGDGDCGTTLLNGVNGRGLPFFFLFFFFFFWVLLLGLHANQFGMLTSL